MSRAGWCCCGGSGLLPGTSTQGMMSWLLSSSDDSYGMASVMWCSAGDEGQSFATHILLWSSFRCACEAGVYLFRTALGFFMNYGGSGRGHWMLYSRLYRFSPAPLLASFLDWIGYCLPAERYPTDKHTGTMTHGLHSQSRHPCAEWSRRCSSGSTCPRDPRC
jgi:hypothetical protein